MHVSYIFQINDKYWTDVQTSLKVIDYIPIERV